MLSDKESLGHWKRETILGSGGFGIVTQWINIDTKDTIAIKQCRLLLEASLNSKLCRRWEVEIDIMKKLNHPNVVTSKVVPEDLEVGKDDLPLMAMEYCTQGDLRKVLTRPENCCGLPEVDVLIMSKHIASAVGYLHSMRIIHRDLKPENIVLQEIDNKIVYKLIDLGYAKELDQNSVCTSFVGTLHYLAPELFGGEKYTCAVDYWSFGLIVFECITGIRPFLANDTPYHWQLKAKSKTPDDICAYNDSDGEVVFSKKLFKPNHMNPIYEEHFEKWLQLMLRWDPQQRGGGLNEDKQPRCFKVLNDIHKLMIAKVYCVSTCETLYIEVTQDMSIMSLKEKIAQRINIPSQEQELLLPRGVPPDLNKPASQCCVLDFMEDEWMIIVFQKNKPLTFGSNPLPLPEYVQFMLQEPKTLIEYNKKKKMWSHAVYYCRKQIEDYNNLNFTQKIILTNLLMCNSALNNKKTLLKEELSQLIAESNFFNKSIDINIGHYRDQVTNGFSSEKMINRWQSRKTYHKKVLDQKNIIDDLEKLANNAEMKVVELQHCPFSASRQKCNLEKIRRDILKEYDDLRKCPKEKRVISTDNETMVKFVAHSIIERKKLSLALITHLDRLLHCRGEINALLPKFDTALSDVKLLRRKLFSEHRETQSDVWGLIGILQNKLNPSTIESESLLASSSTSPVINSISSANIQVQEYSQPQVETLDQVSQNQGLNMSLNEIVDKSLQMTTLLISNNQETRSVLQTSFTNFSEKQRQTLDQLNSLDFSFLNL